MGFKDKLKMSLTGVRGVLSKWQYILIAILITFVFVIIFSLLNTGSSEWALLKSSLPLQDKLEILGYSFIRFFQNITTFTGFLTLIVVTLQGITISLLVYGVIEQRKMHVKTKGIGDRAGESVIASLIASLGLGCSACGTSLIVPLISLISTSAVFISAITTIIIIVAIILLLYSSFQMGLTAYTFITIEKSSIKKEGE